MRKKSILKIESELYTMYYIMTKNRTKVKSLTSHALQVQLKYNVGPFKKKETRDSFVSILKDRLKTLDL